MYNIYCNMLGMDKEAYIPFKESVAGYKRRRCKTFQNAEMAHNEL